MVAWPFHTIHGTKHEVRPGSGTVKVSYVPRGRSTRAWTYQDGLVRALPRDLIFTDSGDFTSSVT